MAEVYSNHPLFKEMKRLHDEAHGAFKTAQDVMARGESSKAEARAFFAIAEGQLRRAKKELPLFPSKALAAKDLSSKDRVALNHFVVDSVKSLMLYHERATKVLQELEEE